MTRLVIYAGPNGSGKSSLRDYGFDSGMIDVVIDPDRIARSLNPADPVTANQAAARKALLS